MGSISDSIYNFIKYILDKIYLLLGWIVILVIIAILLYVFIILPTNAKMNFWETYYGVKII
jgi:hypothetical protein